MSAAVVTLLKFPGCVLTKVSYLQDLSGPLAVGGGAAAGGGGAAAGGGGAVPLLTLDRPGGLVSQGHALGTRRPSVCQRGGHCSGALSHPVSRFPFPVSALPYQ